MGAGSGPAWRSAAISVAVTLCLLPVVVPLVLFCLPLLCFAVAVVRFRRRRRKAATRRTGRCFGGGDRTSLEGAQHRVALLHKYLEDQMELVGADAEEEAGAHHGSIVQKNRGANRRQETELS